MSCGRGEESTPAPRLALPPKYGGLQLAVETKLWGGQKERKMGWFPQDTAIGITDLMVSERMTHRLSPSLHLGISCSRHSLSQHLASITRTGYDVRDRTGP